MAGEEEEMLRRIEAVGNAVYRVTRALEKAFLDGGSRESHIESARRLLREAKEMLDDLQTK